MPTKNPRTVGETPPHTPPVKKKKPRRRLRRVRRLSAASRRDWRAYHDARDSFERREAIARAALVALISNYGAEVLAGFAERGAEVLAGFAERAVLAADYLVGALGLAPEEP